MRIEYEYEQECECEWTTNMAKFQFRLESLTRLRVRERDTAAASYKEALAAKEKLEAHVQELLDEHASQNPLQSQSVIGQVNSQRVIESQRYQMHLMQQVSHIRSQIEMIEAECEKRRQKLVKRDQELSSLQKLADKQQQEWETNELNRQQDALDQWSGFKYWKQSQ